MLNGKPKADKQISKMKSGSILNDKWVKRQKLKEAV